LIAKEIGLRKWGWIGHTLRKGPDDIARQAMSWNPPGKRKPGRPPVTWQSSVRSEAAQQGKKFLSGFGEESHKIHKFRGRPTLHSGAIGSHHYHFLGFINFAISRKKNVLPSCD
jgi:hypothetical protein